MSRACDVCGSGKTSPIFEQRFATFDDGSSFEGYSVVSCGLCGFVYADGIPDQVAFDRYYRDMSKYEERGGLAPAELSYYRSVVAAIADRLPDRAARILDVGSASGDALALFGKIGYTNLTGFDPSPRCAEIARERHGLRVVNTPISQMPFVGEQFDVVMLSGVLEHLRDLQKTLADLQDLLSPNGAFWFGVPDALRFKDFAEAPYQHFSLEHINFFTSTTLQTLLSGIGFRLTDAWESVHNHGAMPEPILNAVFRPTNIEFKPGRDIEGPHAVRQYAASSAQVEKQLTDNVRTLVDQQTPVVVWGTGSLTMHLLTTRRFRELNIVAFVDGNPNYWNKTLLNLPVVPPSEMFARPETILVVSYAYENEIAHQVRDVYKLGNPIFRMFSSHEIV